jgi:hypothetical protein
MMEKQRSTGQARLPGDANQPPNTIDAATGQEVEDWANRQRAKGYTDIKIYPKPSDGVDGIG